MLNSDSIIKSILLTVFLFNFITSNILSIYLETTQSLINLVGDESTK